MRRLLFIVQKEFIQIVRNKAILPLMTIAPIMQLIVLSFAASNEVTNIQLVLRDADKSEFSRLLSAKISQSERFVLYASPESDREADEMLQDGSADIVLSIPAGFEKDFYKYGTGQLQPAVNAINGQQATVGAAYLGAILLDFNLEIIEKTGLLPDKIPATFSVTSSDWYNPELDFKAFMVPGILGEIVTILVMMLTAMNVVREREIGTIEQINVTPIKKWQFILGKMIPFLFIGMMLMGVGLTAGKLIFDIPFRGSLLLVFAYCFVNLTAVLGLGLFISNLADTQQQAMFVTFFFVIIFILMSGLFTPIESMPVWAQYLTEANPVAHFVHVMRSVLMKGSNFADVAHSFRATFVLSLVFNILAVWSYRKTV